MNNMNGMPNMANGMFNNFGGNMGMAGMNDMSAMNMMNYGGGYGNWGQGANGGGFNNFNGYNQMGGYNQTGAQYPEMMNQFPKNNFTNQNRFHANGAAFPNQRNNRNGSFGGHGSSNNGSGPGAGINHNVNSRPGSRGAPLQNVRRFHKLPPAPLASCPSTDMCSPQQRDGQSPAGNAEAATETKVKGEHAQSSTVPAAEGKVDSGGGPEATTSQTAQAGGAPAGDVAAGPDGLTQAAGEESNSAPQTSGLNRIQTVDSIELDNSAAYDDPMMIGAMHPGQTYGQGMISDYSNQMSHMNGGFHQNMGFNQNMGYSQNIHGSRGGFNTAYGAATVLVGEPLGEPKGLGVEGAPKGPRAMREGRPNTGFASRAPAHARSISNAPAVNGPPAVEAAAGSPPRRGRA